MLAGFRSQKFCIGPARVLSVLFFTFIAFTTQSPAAEISVSSLSIDEGQYSVYFDAILYPADWAAVPGGGNEYCGPSDLWFTRFTLIGVDASATFRNAIGEPGRDLELFWGPTSYTDRFYEELCSDQPSPPPSYTFKNFRVLAIEDEIEEGTENATLELRNHVVGGTDVATITVYNVTVPTPGVLGFIYDSYLTDEGTGWLVEVERTGGSDGGVSVDFQAISGTATNDDYTVFTSGPLSWGDGDSSSRYIDVFVEDDDIEEGWEEFTIELFNPTGGASIARSTVQIDIPPSDIPEPMPGVLEFSWVWLGSDEGASPNIEVTRTGGSDGVVSVEFQAIPGTATPNDYTLLTSSPLVWADGDTANRYIQVQFVDDDLEEGEEEFDLQLFNSTGGATLGRSLIDISIYASDIPDPVPGQLFIDNHQGTEENGQALATIERRNGSDGAITVDFRTVDGTALAGSDYVATSGQISWADGDTGLKSIWVDLIDDDEEETDEYFNIVIETPTGGATIGAGTSTFTILGSDEIIPVTIDSLGAQPDVLFEGETTTLSWSVSNADNCTASGGAGGWAGRSISLPSGSVTLTLSQVGQLEFVLSCTNEGSSDSASVGVSVSAELQPDLRVDSAAIDKSSIEPGQSVVISAVLRNSGNAAAVASTIRYYLSTNESIGVADQQLDATPSMALAAGQTQNLNQAVKISTGAGNYWIGACVDSIPNEVSQSNNCSGGVPITVISATGNSCSSQPIGCDAVLDGILNSEDCTSGPLGSGHYAEKFTYSGSVGDQLFLSADWTFDGYLLLADPNGLIRAENDNHTGPGDSHIEYELTQNGTHTVWATSFDSGTTGSFDLSLGCDSSSGPDLTLDAPSTGSGALLPGQSMTLATTLRNVGDAAADSTTLRYRLSSNSVIDTSDATLGMDGASALAAGQSRAANLSLTAPATPGDWYLGVCADAVSGESSTSNNCSPATRITVSQPPSCTQSSLTCGALRSGELTTSDCMSSPRGNGSLAERFDLTVTSGQQLSIEAAWGSLDGYLYLLNPQGRVVAENDDGGSGSRIEYKVTQEGTHSLWLTSYQRNETGSFEVELYCGSATAPDLRASAVGLNAGEISIGDTISLSGSVQNIGNAGGSATEVNFMLSSNSTISLLDEVLASSEVGALATGASQSVSQVVSAPASAGNYWLGICVEPVAGETLTDNNCSQVSAETSTASVEAVSGKPGPQSDPSENGTLLVVSSGNSCESVSLACGGSHSGTLNSSDCDAGPRGTGYVSDPLTFNGSPGDVVTVESAWTGVDGYLYLEDPQGALAASNDDSEAPEASRLEVSLEQSGTYTLWPTAFAKDSDGSYRVTLDCNNPQSPDLLVDTPQLSTNTLRSGQRLTISTQVRNQGASRAAPGVIDFILAAEPGLDGRYRVLGSSDLPELDAGASAEETVDLAVDVTPGTYYVGSCIRLDAQEIDTDNNCKVSNPVTVEATAEPIAINNGLNDAWYNPATDGQGFFINVFPDINLMFLSWFTYDTTRPPGSVPYQLGDPGHRWLTAQGTYDRGVAELDVYLSEGGAFDAEEPAATTDLAPYGSMTVTFSDCKTGQIEFDLPAIAESGSIPITRVAPDNIRVCEEKIGALTSESDGDTDEGGNGGFTYNASLNDAWYNPATDGQGFFFNIYPDSKSVFLSWFTYELQRPPEDTPFDLGEPGHRWLTAQGEFEGDTATMKVFNSTGGVFNSGSLPPGSTLEAGRMTARFDNCNSGVVDYAIDSVNRQGSVPIQRTARDTIPACEQQSQGGAGGAAAGVSPSGKSTLENRCNGSVNWYFNWPDVANASYYIFELYRNDSLANSPRVATLPQTSEFSYEGKESSVEKAHLDNWKWRYRPVMGFGVKTRVSWSKYYYFNVRPPEDPCLD